MAIVDHPTTTWQAMQEGNVFYRRQQCYSIPGKLPHLGDYIIAGCRYGGPIALMRDHTKLLSLGRAMPAIIKAQIQVYSPAGEGLLLFMGPGQDYQVWMDDRRDARGS